MTNYFSGFYPLEGSSGAKGSAAFLGAISTAIVYLYRRSATVLTDSDKPNGNVVYTFATSNMNIAAVTNGWSTTIPAGSNPLYVVSATASATDPTDTILTAQWSTPAVLAQNGAQGSAGINSATVFLFQRSASTTPPAAPSTTTTYTFSSGILSGTLGSWSQNAPPSSGGKYLYVTTATAAGTGPTDDILTGEWSAVRLMSQDGSDGNPGANGISPPAIVVTRKILPLEAYADGSVKTFANANGFLTVQQGGSDVTASATINTPVLSGCTGTINTAANTPVNGQPKGYYQVTAASSNNATMTLSVTVSGVTLTEVVSVSKLVGGDEIVSSLPTTNLFEGRKVYLTTDGQTYKYKSGSWKSETDAAEIIGLVQSSQLAQIGTDKLPMGSGANLLTGSVPGTNPQRYLSCRWNPDNAQFYDAVTTGLQTATDRNIIFDPISAWPVATEWKMPDNSNFAIWQRSNGTPSFNVSDFPFDRVVDQQGTTAFLFPIEPSKFYEGTVYLGAHRCPAWLFILWYDTAQQQISTTPIINSGLAYIAPDEKLGGYDLSNYKRLIARGQAPSNARFAALIIRKGATISGSTDSWIFGTRPMLAETVSNPSQPLPYSPPPPGLFHAESIISNTIDTRHLRANSVKTQTLDAYAVTATKVALTSMEDVFPDPQFRDLVWWNMSDVGSYSANSGSAVANQPYRFARCSVGSADRLSVPVPLEAGAWLRTKLRIYISPDAQGWWGCTQHWPNQAWYGGGGSRTYRADVDSNGYPLIDLATTSIPKGQWVTLTSLDQFHPGTSYLGADNYIQQRTRYNITQGFVEYAFETVRANDAELIVDGSIVANKIAAGAVTASKINVTDLSAINANVGTLTAGTIRNVSDSYRMDVTNGRTIAQTGGYMKVTGAPFGSSNQFIEWYGPYNANLATCTESNAIYYLKTNGSAYFGGTLSAGVIRNATQTTVVSPSASTELGPFGSNGGTRTVVASLTFQVNYIITNTVSYSGSTTATTVVERWNGSSWVQIGSFNSTGNVVVATNGNGPSEPGNIRIEMGGSVTISDNSGGTSGIRLRARITSWTDHSISSTVQSFTNSQTLALISTEG